MDEFARVPNLQTPVMAMPSTLVSPDLLPILLLVGSNVFMTLAWYGHLRFKDGTCILAMPHRAS